MKNKLILAALSLLTYSSCTLDSVNELRVENAETAISKPEITGFSPTLSANEAEVLNWLINVQQENGLLTSTEDSNMVSLYDNSLAALVFLSIGEIDKAEKILDYFNGKIDSEFIPNEGGFFQFRDKTGNNGSTIWLGDNAWLLIALNNHQKVTGDTKYNRLRSLLETWIRSLQDIDGGLWGGYRENGRQIHKITEGIITAFNAVQGYDHFHKDLLEYLEKERWDTKEELLIAWPENPDHYFALDLHSLGYLIFEGFSEDVLYKADRYKNTQISEHNGNEISGYCFDEDKDVIWLEGTAQIALAFQQASNTKEANSLLEEIKKSQIEGLEKSSSKGVPYATNHGSSYGTSMLWSHASNRPALSSSIWYIFSSMNYNPLEIERQKNIPEEDKFWVQ